MYAQLWVQRTQRNSKRKEGNPIITKDGVTIANFIDLDDPFENLAAQIVKQAAAKTIRLPVMAQQRQQF